MNSAQRWGILDIMCGGFISTLVKRKKMQGAQIEAEQAQIAIANFKDQLDDVFDLDLKLDDFLSFSDYFFEGLFFGDMVVQGRINEALNKLTRTIDIIERIKRQLQDLLNG